MRLQLLIGCVLLNFVAGYAGNQDAEQLVDDTSVDLDQALDQDPDPEIVSWSQEDQAEQIADSDADDASEQAAELASEYDSDFNMPSTLDTLGFDDSGNWVEKRVYWERAEEAYGKLRAINAQVSQEQLQYFGMRNEVDKQLTAGRCELGLNEAELAKVLDYLLGVLQAAQNQVQADKNDFKVTLLDNQDQLLLLQTSLEQLAQFDTDLDSVVVKAIDQVQKSNEYERKAWEDFKQIGRVLNDESARQLYYQVASYRKNSKLILKYLKTDLKNSFENLIARLKAKLSQIKKITGELKDAGIDLKYELKALDQDRIYNKDGAKLADTSEEDVKPASQKAKSKTGFWSVVFDSLGLLWQLILWLPRKILGLFGLKF